MFSAEKETLLRSLDEIRQTNEELLPEIDPEKDIYPGCIIKHILAHIPNL
jgi:hypothetical protein